MCDFGPHEYEDAKRVAVTGKPSFWNIFRKPKDWSSKRLDYSEPLKGMAPRVALSSPGRRGQLWDELVTLTGAQWPKRHGKNAPDLTGRRLEEEGARLGAPLSWDEMADEAAAIAEQVGCCRAHPSSPTDCRADGASAGHRGGAAAVCERRRRRLQSAAAAIESRAIDSRPPAAGGAAPACDARGLCRAEAAWFDEWGERLGCWWLSLPVPTQGELSGCLGALGLHLGSRFDAAIRLVHPSRLGGANAHAAEPGCEWLSRSAEELNLPEFPSRADFEFTLPPIPRLLPDVQQLHSFTSDRQELFFDLKNAAAETHLDETLAAIHATVPQQRPMVPQLQQRELNVASLAAGASLGGVLSALVLTVAMGRTRQHIRVATRGCRTQSGV